MLYLLTGRRGMCMMLPANLWYEERLDEIVERERRMPQVAREHGLEYFYVNRAVKGDLTEDIHRRVLQAFDNLADLRPMFTSGEDVLYKVRPATAASRSGPYSEASFALKGLKFVCVSMMSTPSTRLSQLMAA